MGVRVRLTHSLTLAYHAPRHSLSHSTYLSHPLCRSSTCLEAPTCPCDVVSHCGVIAHVCLWCLCVCVAFVYMCVCRLCVLGEATGTRCGSERGAKKYPRSRIIVYVCMYACMCAYAFIAYEARLNMSGDYPRRSSCWPRSNNVDTSVNTLVPALTWS